MHIAKVGEKSLPTCTQRFNDRFSASQIHLDMAKYHELGRFAPDDGSRNMEAALYHLRHAADCGALEAIIAMARICLQMTHDVLVEVNVSVSDGSLEKSLAWVEILRLLFCMSPFARQFLFNLIKWYHCLLLICFFYLDIYCKTLHYF